MMPSAGTWWFQWDRRLRARNEPRRILRASWVASDAGARSLSTLLTRSTVRE